jgi:parallel beta-helix repeat protein
MKYLNMLALTIALLFTAADAAVWYVHPDSTMNCIQNCLDSCSTGDTVLVGPGTYYENITWPNTDGIDLISEYGSDTTIIDGDSADRVIYINGVDTTTVIRGFTIQNGYVNSFGGGIYCEMATPRIVNNIFTANDAQGMFGGGAIACRLQGSSAVIDSNTIYGNHGIYGGGITLYANSDPIFTNNLIHDNTADSLGGGIQCYLDCDATVEGNTITDNTAKWGGGLAIWNTSSPIVSGNIISGNTATSMGGGIYCYLNVVPTITDNTINDNYCYNSAYGAGIRSSPGMSGVIKHCDISDNNGHGLSIGQSSPDIDSCAIENNNQYGVYVYNASNPTINYCNIAGNQDYGVYNGDAGYTINAENNWWGDASGPGGVGPGTGNWVSNYVDFDPWLGQPGIEEYTASSPFALELQVSPNPFHHSTEIRFTIEKADQNISGSASRVSEYQNPDIRIYDATGRLVRDFFLPTTYYLLPTAVSWDGTDQANRQLGSGVYFVTLRAGNYAETRKVLLVR